MQSVQRLLFGLLLLLVLATGISIFLFRSGDADAQSLSVGAAKSPHDALRSLNRIRRGPSLRDLFEQQSDAESLMQHARNKTVWVVDGADDFELIQDGDSQLDRFAGMLNGQVLTTEIGSGVPLTDDGYVLTAAHCVVTGRALVLAAKNGSPVQAFQGTVIWNGLLENPRQDLVILRVSGLHFDAAAPRAVDVQVASGTRVLCSGSGAGGLCVAGGRVVILDDDTRTGTIEAPLLPGDSGGPVFLANGALLGIMSTASISGSRTLGTIVCPDWNALLQKIHDDRQHSESNVTVESSMSSAGTIRMMQLDEELQSAISTFSPRVRGL